MLKRIFKEIFIIIFVVCAMPLTILADGNEYYFDEYGIKNGVVVPQSTDNCVIELDSKENVPIDKMWTVRFNQEVALDKIIAMSIKRGNRFLAIDIDLIGDSRATITPRDNYEYGMEYSVSICLTSGRWYTMKFRTIEDYIVKFPDDILEGDIRESINKPVGDIYYSDVAKIKILNSGKGVNNIEGIQHLTNLEELNMSLSHGIGGNIDQLSGLTKLKTLSLIFCGLRDISAIENLTNLEELYLSDNAIKDISPLVNLRSLKRLGLNLNIVNDTSPLRNMSKLEYINLQHNDVENLSGFEGLTNLKEANLTYNKIADISGVENLKNLNSIALSFNEIDDITHLVENRYLGEGDGAYIGCNHIDLSLGSKQLENVQELLERGVDLGNHYGNQYCE